MQPPALPSEQLPSEQLPSEQLPSEQLPHRSPSRHSAPGRRALRALSVGLIVLGALALLDAGVTLVWQEPFSALYAKFQQDHLRGALHDLERAKPTAPESAHLARLASERRRISYLAGE